jgi:hypothetical protein
MLVYRDKRQPRPSAFRVPPHLEGANLERREGVSGDLIAHSRPLMKDGVVGIQDPASDADWLDLPNDWQVYLAGEFVPEHYLKNHRDRPTLIPVLDGKGRIWHAPAILSPDLKNPEGDVILSLGWGRDPITKVISRTPTAAQKTMISAARAYRAELLKKRLDEVPAATAAEWFFALMGSVYHLHEEMVIKWQWMDDILVAGYCLASCGFPKPIG